MQVGIALGSNIEPRLLHLHTARRRLFELHSGGKPVLCSKVYETSPVDCPEGSAPFLNAVLEIDTECTPQELLVRLQEIEQSMGRPSAHEKNSPRTIDLDMLYCGDMALSDESLTLPHPRIKERHFVLQPLADIRPNLILPKFTKSVKVLASELKTSERLSVFTDTIY